MWEQVGILRDGEGLAQAAAELESLGAELWETGITDPTTTFNLTWHDWLNLDSQILTSRAIAAAASARADSRGAHYREDFSESGPLQESTYTRVRLVADRLEVDSAPVAFSIVAPGESLVPGAFGAEPAREGGVP